MTEPFINPKAVMIIIILFLLAMLILLTCDKNVSEQVVIKKNPAERFEIVDSQLLNNYGTVKIGVLFDNLSRRSFLVYQTQNGIGICPLEYTMPTPPSKPTGLK